MASRGLPAGWDATSILQGLHTAMAFGEPNRTGDKATFCWYEQTDDSVSADSDGVPFGVDQRRTRTLRSLQVPCAVEFVDKSDQQETFGALQATRVKITLLDPDYKKVSGFQYVVLGGDRYDRRITEPPVALGSIDVWTVHAVAEDES